MARHFMCRINAFGDKFREVFKNRVNDKDSTTSFDWHVASDGKELPDLESGEEESCMSVEEFTSIIEEHIAASPEGKFQFWQGKTDEYGVRLAWRVAWKCGCVQLTPTERVW